MIVQKKLTAIQQQVKNALYTHLAELMTGSTYPLATQKMVDTIIKPYVSLEYYCIPLNVEHEEDYNEIITMVSCEYLNRYSYIFSMVTNSLDFRNLNTAKEVVETYENTGTKENNGNSKGMSENAPINADITIIDSPNTKAQTETLATQNNSDSGTKNYSENNPYYFDTFMSIMKRYNIQNIIDSAIQKILVEYTTII